MSDLVRQRNARDLWISRSHLHAAGAGVLLLVLLAFASGMLLGRGRTPAVEAARYQPITAALPGDDLVELLARVERNAHAHPSAAMVYPAWAEKKGDLPVPEVVPRAPGVAAVVAATADAVPGQADAVPDADWTVDAGTYATREEAVAVRDRFLGLTPHRPWATVRLVDGEPSWWVGVGGFRSAAEANAAIPQLAPVAEGLTLSAARIEGRP